MRHSVQLTKANPVLPPKQPGGPFRCRVFTAYMDNADLLFGAFNDQAFTFGCDEHRFSACLNQELSAPFRILPGSNPTIEITVDVYCDSYDLLIRGKTFYLSNED